MERRLTREWDVSAYDKEKGEWTTTTNKSYEIIEDGPDIEELLVRRAPKATIRPTRRKKPTRSDTRTLIAGDSQIPFQDDRSMDRFQDSIAASNPDNIVLLGDMVDLPSLSRYQQRREWTGEVQDSLDTYYEFLAQTRSNAPNAEITVLHGNHEKRMNDYLIKNASEVLGLRRAGLAKSLAVLSIRYLVRYDELDIGVVDGYPNGALWLEDNLKAVHGTNTQKGGANAAKYLREESESTIFGHCFDMETELLTEDGWKKRCELTLDDKAVTYNLESGVLEYNKIQSFSDYEDYTELYEIKHRRGDLLVTDKHGLVDVSSNKPVLFDAKDFNKKARRTMLSAGKLEREGTGLSTDELRLIVWVAADGGLEHKTGVRFHLLKRRKIERLTELLTDLGITHSVRRTRVGTTKIYFNAKGTVIEKYFTWGDKKLPSIVKSCNYDEAQVLLEEYTHTDGNRNKKYRHAGQLATSKVSEANMIHEILVTNGISANLTKRPKGHIISFNQRTDRAVYTGRRAKKVPHKGRVWCVTVDNHTLMVRRNGKVTITQNTHRQELAYRTVNRRFGAAILAAASPGCLARIDGTVPGYRHTIDAEDQLVTHSEDWQNGVLIVDHNEKTHNITPVLFQEDGYYIDGKKYD